MSLIDLLCGGKKRRQIPTALKFLITSLLVIVLSVIIALEIEFACPSFIYLISKATVSLPCSL
jgi:hypothetical protein